MSVWHGVFWNHLIYPELASDEVEDPELTIAWVHDHLMRGEFPDYVVCVNLDDYPQLPVAERSKELRRCKTLLHDMLPPQQRQLLGFAHGNALYFCGTFADTSAPHPHDAMLGMLQRLRQEIDHLGVSVTIGIAFLNERSLGEWRWAAQRAIVAQRSKVCSGANRVYVYDQHVDNARRSFANYWHLGETLYALVRSGEVERTETVLRDTVQAFFRTVYFPLSHLLPILQSQIILMAQAAREVGVEAAAMQMETDRFLEHIGTTFDYAQLRAVIEQAAAFYTAQVHHQHYHRTGSRLIAACDEYLKAHLDDPELGLQQLAEALDTSPSYLSRCFKKAHGVGITEQINRQRVEVAKLLLLDEKLPVTDIAFRLGFGSLQHFGRVFKTYEDCTPTEYRQAKIAQGR